MFCSLVCIVVMVFHSNSCALDATTAAIAAHHKAGTVVVFVLLCKLGPIMNLARIMRQVALAWQISPTAVELTQLLAVVICIIMMFT